MSRKHDHMLKVMRHMFPGSKPSYLTKHSKAAGAIEICMGIKTPNGFFAVRDKVDDEELQNAGGEKQATELVAARVGLMLIEIRRLMEERT